MNKEHMKRQSHATQLAQVKSYMKDYPNDMLERLLPTIMDRINTYGELASIEKEEFHFLINCPDVDKEKVRWKDSPLPVALEHLKHVREIIATADLSTPESVKQAIMPYAEERGKGDVLWPLRVTLSGQEKSVDPFTLVYVLGKEESIARIDTMRHKLEG